MNFKLKKNIKTYYLVKTLNKQGLNITSQTNDNKNKYITKDLFKNIFNQILNVKSVKFPLFLIKKEEKTIKFDILKKKNIIFTKKEQLNKLQTNTLELVKKYNKLLNSSTKLLQLFKLQKR